MVNKYFRLNLSLEEFEDLKANLNFSNIGDSLIEKMQNPIEINIEKKMKSTSIATASRSKKAKEKIQNAINILRLECKNITHYSIAQMSGVSFTTVKKYLNSDTLKSLSQTPKA